MKRVRYTIGDWTIEGPELGSQGETTVTFRGVEVPGLVTLEFGQDVDAGPYACVELRYEGVDAKREVIET